MKMLEKMARAIALDLDGTEIDWGAYENAADAILNALMNPSDETMDAFQSASKGEWNMAMHKIKEGA